MPLYLFDGLVCIAARSKAEARFREARFDDRREHLGDGLLDNPVHHGRDAQQPLAAVVLGNFNPADGLRAVAPGFELAAVSSSAPAGGRESLSMAMPSIPVRLCWLSRVSMRGVSCRW